MKKLLVLIAALAITIVTAVPAAAGPPTVEMVDTHRTLNCASEAIDVFDTGKVRYHDSVENPTHIDFHIVRTYVNGDGDTWVYHDTGLVRYFTVDGEDYVSVSGHSAGVGPDNHGNYGRFVISLPSGELISIVGSDRGVLDDVACEALTS